ncbi:MAG: undecaprenyl-diphosphate phosphatase, partial [Gammaproteobacteria bacterium]|nr:undecaprenyl-diphosphate phosphatase [Gammaproteobacteria bacterium]
ASLPVIIVGGLLKDVIATELRGTEIIAATTIIFAFALWFADSRRHSVAAPAISLKHAFIIGLAQTLALIPGTSRAGITITAALLLGLSRRQSLNFSFLLAIPVIGGAAVLNVWDMLQEPEMKADLWYPLIVGFIISAVFALLTIKLFIRFVERIGLLPFVIYRILLGIVLLLLITN